MKMELILSDPQAVIAAQIDLKQARVYIEDGYDGPGGTPAVNLMAGYTAGAVTMAVDGFDGEVEVYDRFTVVGSTAVHTITAHTPTSGDTTSITFTPALTGTVADDAVITMLCHQLEVTIGEGNCSYDETRTFEYKKNRGLLDKVRQGDEEPLEVSLDFVWEYVSSGEDPNPPTIIEALKQIGNAAHWVSSGADPCEKYCVDITIVNTPECEDVDPETHRLPEFRYEKLSFSMRDGTISCTGKCNVTEATVTRG